MANKAHKRKERLEQRRKQKEKQRQKQKEKRKQARERIEAGLQPVGTISGVNLRHRQRLEQQIPRAWPGELAEDIAVFDTAARSALSPELAQQATAVHEALRDATESRGEAALKRVSAIPRGSPLSEWRLFLRGLVDWLAGETEAAGEAWKRLDTKRRPGRIAMAMMLALRSDLEGAAPAPEQTVPQQTASQQTASVQAAPKQTTPEQAAPEQAASEQAASEQAASDQTTPEQAALDQTTPVQAAPETSAQGQPRPSEAAEVLPISPWDRFDAQQLYHAKLLRKTRFDRVALRIAEAGLKVPEEDTTLLLGPNKIRWLRRFLQEFADTEPDLVAALSQAALGRAFGQNFANVFHEALQAFPGPRHDRRHRLLSFFYYCQFRDSDSEKRAKRSLDEYLNHDLPQNESLPAPLRRAIASQIHLNEAMDLTQSNVESRMLDFIFKTRDTSKTAHEHFLAAVKAEPTHGLAYKAHASWLKSKLDDHRLTDQSRETFENHLADVMENWSKGQPDEVEPRLWLVDRFLENDQLEEARPHVEFLAACRHDDPLVRAMPWKWQLLNAMRLCRRKAWLAQASAALDEAEKLWPAWLSKEWLPYLRAALALRNGQKQEFEERRRKICEDTGRAQGSLADACLMLGAAQQVQTSAAGLKPFRAELEPKVKSLTKLPIEDLFDVGSFFWDLDRTNLRYPALRMHGHLIGKELTARLKKSENVVLKRLDDERMIKAVLWASEHRFWAAGDESPLPTFLNSPVAREQPFLLAAKLNALLNRSYHYGIGKEKDLGPALREAARSQRDAYYRYWFNVLAEKLDDVLARLSSRSSRFGGFPFGDMFGNTDDEGDGWDDDDEDWDDDDEDAPE